MRAAGGVNDDVLAGLRKHFGHTDFRPGQEPIVGAVLDVLAVMPTGSGKSLGCQLPAVMLGPRLPSQLPAPARCRAGLPTLVRGRRALVYAATRKSVEAAATLLEASGVHAAAYHGAAIPLSRIGPTVRVTPRGVVTLPP